jgi:tetratricopeptide (TPR) repeat protein
MSSVTPRATLRAAAPLLTKSLLFALLVSAFALNVSAQGIGAHRGDMVSAGGGRSIQGRIISPTGKLPESHIRVTLEQADSGPRVTYADDDGGFNFNGLEGGPYTLTIDAGKEFELARESVYIEGGKPVYNVPVYLRMKPEANPALAGVPAPAIELFKKAIEAERKNDDAKAATLLNEALARHPPFALAHNELGRLAFKAGQLDKAVEEFKTGSKTLPDDPQAQTDYGLVLLEKKDYAEAEKQFRKAVKKMDKSAQVHTYLGVSLMRQKGADEAERTQKLADSERELQQAIKLGGDSAARAHYYLGGLYWARREYKKAADELETYLKLAPKSPDAEQVRGTIKELRSK